MRTEGKEWCCVVCTCTIDTLGDGAILGWEKPVLAPAPLCVGYGLFPKDGAPLALRVDWRIWWRFTWLLLCILD